MSYDDKDIKVLQGLEGVRLRPGMYLRSPSGPEGVLQLITEATDNSKDEALAGHCNHIKIVLDTKTNEVIVADNGRGIPQKSIVKTYGYLHSGGKFNTNTYKVSGGLHGVGSAVINGLSVFTNVYSTRGSKTVCGKFEKGLIKRKEHKTKVPTTLLFKKAKIKGKQGTIVHFKPDFSILTHGKLPYKDLMEWLNLIPLLCPKLKVDLTVLGKAKVSKTYYSKKGLAEHKKAGDFYYKSETMDILIKFLGEPDYKGYVNIMPIDDGVHTEGFWQAYKGALTPYVTGKKGKMPKTATLKATCNVVMHCLVSEPLFIGQTKDKLAGKDVKQDVANELKKGLADFFKKKKGLAKKLVKFAQKVETYNTAQRKELASLRDIQKKSKKGKLPPALAVATTAKPQDRELFLVEGESAAGNCKTARDKKYQEVLPLKGKILNVSKAKSDKILSSQEVQDIILALGDSDPKKGRVGKLYLFSDADPDGGHISALLVTAFIKLLPEWLDQGRVYIVRAPLFHTIYKDKRVFGNSMKEVQDQVPKSCIVMRAKGLGECRANDLKYMAFDKNTRVVEQLKSSSKAVSVVLNLMGKNSDSRKKLIGLE